MFVMKVYTAFHKNLLDILLLHTRSQTKDRPNCVSTYGLLFYWLKTSTLNFVMNIGLFNDDSSASQFTQRNAELHTSN